MIVVIRSLNLRRGGGGWGCLNIFLYTVKLQDFNSEYGFIELDIIAEDLTRVIAGSVFVFKAEVF